MTMCAASVQDVCREVCTVPRAMCATVQRCPYSFVLPTSRRVRPNDVCRMCADGPPHVTAPLGWRPSPCASPAPFPQLLHDKEATYAVA